MVVMRLQRPVFMLLSQFQEEFNEVHTPKANMKMLLALILICSSVFAADTNDIQVVSMTKTNAQSDSVTTTDVYTRDGQTNLVRDTRIKAGTVQIRSHRFYHAGSLVCNFTAMPHSSGFVTEAGSPYGVSFEFWPSKAVRSAVIGTKDGVILDAFTCTNGMFYPDDSSRISKANAILKDLSGLLSPSHVTNTPPEVFGRETEQFIEEHKDK